ncbi:MAG TPA: exodeoxyribonuclease III [Anaerolineales bacterium]|nr:exodeoxyribonuclease III [Anaerolineales bacterium]HLO28218.1 exodeoxyribonuclease III [Anaerolineales bacterium]
MKIITWNVNGLRAALGRDSLQWAWEQQPDALCLQEIKARPEQLKAEQRNFPGYDVIWNPAEKAGYSGVATFLRSPSLELRLGMDAPLFDIEGRLISTLHPGFRLFNVYFPSGQRGRERVEYKLDFYAQLLSLCDRLHSRGENLIVTGDFNTAHMPIDLKNPKQNALTSGFLPEERALFQKFLDHGFVDAYRRLYPDRVQYTWWTYRLSARERRVGWRLDYFLVTEALAPLVRDVIIHEEVLGSDHCPVELIVG